MIYGTILGGIEIRTKDSDFLWKLFRILLFEGDAITREGKDKTNCR